MTIIELENLIKTLRSSQLGGLGVKLKNDKILLQLLIELTNFLPENTTNGNRIYYVRNNLHEIKKCKYCNKIILIPRNNFCNPKCNINWQYENTNKSESQTKFLLNRFANKSKEEINLLINREKYKQTMIENYGVDHNFKIKECLDQRKETWLKNLGVDNPNKNKEVREKIHKTCTKRYNSISPLNGKEQIIKKKNTWKKNLGVDNPSKNEEIKIKKENTCLKNHGVKNPSQSKEICEKQRDTWFKNKIANKHNNFKYKTFEFESGNKIICQGDEIKALNEWILTKYIESDIINTISFMHKLNFRYLDDNSIIKERKYIPDFYIIPDNLIIEVKSNYLYWKRLNNIEQKALSVIKKNYNFILLIHNGKKFIEKTYEEIKSDLEKICK